VPGDPVRQARDWLISQTGHEPADPPPPPGSGTGAARRAAGPASRGADRCSPTADQDSRDADQDADPASVARSILVRKLAAQDRTRHELAAALAAKNVPGEVAEEVLDRFAEIGLVDDESYARRWVESRQGRRHRSRTLLRRELAGKGVAREVVDEALTGVTTEDEVMAARAYVEKVGRSMTGLQPTIRQRRLADRLARRGFGAEIIRRVLKDMDDEGI
jgi:regulatory protein